VGWVADRQTIETAFRRAPQTRAGTRAVAETIAAEAQLIGASDAYADGVYVSMIDADSKPNGGAVAQARAKHSAPLEGGTGLFGPFQHMIRAKAGRLMAFETRLPPPPTAQDQAKVLGGTNRLVVIKEHRGMPARHVMERAGRQVAARLGKARWVSKPWEPRP
jgi:hypothetical protein